MIVLGVDPGTATTGYSLLEVNVKGLVPIEFNLIETKKNLGHSERLSIIYEQILKIITLGKPDVMAIEKIFFAANAKTAIAVGQAQGVMFLAAQKLALPVVEYAPGTIKKVVSGDGRANKKKMQQALRKIFGASIRSKARKKTHFDNAADALAVAYCHAMLSRGR